MVQVMVEAQAAAVAQVAAVAAQAAAVAAQAAEVELHQLILSYISQNMLMLKHLLTQQHLMGIQNI
jgi:hypothetical protein